MNIFIPDIIPDELREYLLLNKCSLVDQIDLCDYIILQDELCIEQYVDIIHEKNIRVILLEAVSDLSLFKHHNGVSVIDPKFMSEGFISVLYSKLLQAHPSIEFNDSTLKLLDSSIQITDYQWSGEAIDQFVQNSSSENKRQLKSMSFMMLRLLESMFYEELGSVTLELFQGEDSELISIAYSYAEKGLNSFDTELAHSIIKSSSHLEISLCQQAQTVGISCVVGKGRAGSFTFIEEYELKRKLVPIRGEVVNTEADDLLDGELEEYTALQDESLLEEARFVKGSHTQEFLQEVRFDKETGANIDETVLAPDDYLEEDLTKIANIDTPPDREHYIGTDIDEKVAEKFSSFINENEKNIDLQSGDTEQIYENFISFINSDASLSETEKNALETQSQVEIFRRIATILQGKNKDLETRFVDLREREKALKHRCFGLEKQMKNLANAADKDQQNFEKEIKRVEINIRQRDQKIMDIQRRHKLDAKGHAKQRARLEAKIKSLANSDSNSSKGQESQKSSGDMLAAQAKIKSLQASLQNYNPQKEKRIEDELRREKNTSSRLLSKLSESARESKKYMKELEAQKLKVKQVEHGFKKLKDNLEKYKKGSEKEVQAIDENLERRLNQTISKLQSDLKTARKELSEKKTAAHKLKLELNREKAASKASKKKKAS